MIITRFCPTTNGYLHLGHMYQILVNYWTAKLQGGKFILRFDDDYPAALVTAELIQTSKKIILQDLEWLNLFPDEITSCKAERGKNNKEIRKRLKTDYVDAIPYVRPCVKTGNYYPYAPNITILRVMQDYRENCNLLLRGEDLISEDSLYRFICEMLDIPIPKMQYLPILTAEDNGCQAQISKTNGGWKICDFRKQGYSPEELKIKLSEYCLMDPYEPWLWDNIKHKLNVLSYREFNGVV